MPIDGLQRLIPWLEGAFLLASAPLLLFPTTFPPATAIALMLLAVGWLLSWRPGRGPWPRTPFNAAILLWTVMLLVGVLVTADPELTLPKTTGLLLGLASWRYLSLYVRSERVVWPVVTAFVLVGLGIIGVGILSANWRFEVAFVERLFRLLPPQLIQLPAAPEAGVHTNQLAGTLLFYFPLSLALIPAWNTFRRGRFVLALSILFAGFLAGLLLLTQSRSAWSGVAAGITSLVLMWALLSPRRSRLRYLMLILLSLLAIAMVIGLVALWPSFRAALNAQPPTSTPIGTLQTIAFRFEVWRWALVAIGDFPFTGTGLGTFREVVGRLYPIVYRSDTSHAHNIFMQVALDTGLPGLVSYLSLLMLSAVLAWRLALVDVKYRALSIGIFSGLVAFHVYGLTDALAPGSKPAIAFWLALGLLTAMWNVVTVQEKQQEETESCPPHPSPT